MGNLEKELEKTEENDFWNILEETEDEEFQRIILLYGKSGVGKTRLASQFWVNDLPPLLLSFDPGELGGAMSALEFKPLHRRIRSYEEFFQLIPRLEEDAGKKFGVVIADSMSYFARMSMNDILAKINKEIPRFDEFNLNAERVRKACKMITDLGCHVIFTAINSYQKDEVTGGVLEGPDLPGKLAKELPQYCDVTAKLDVSSEMKVEGKKVVRSAIYTYTVVGDTTFEAKDRTGLLDASGFSEFENFKVLFKNPKKEG